METKLQTNKQTQIHMLANIRQKPKYKNNLIKSNFSIDAIAWDFEWAGTAINET